MAKRAGSSRRVSIRLACEAFGISETCYRYVRVRDAENDEIANWLLRLTDNHRGALLERGLDATQFVPGGRDRLLRLDALRLDFAAQRVERSVG